MCGRLTQLTSPEDLARIFKTERGVDVVREVLAAPRYNVAPSQQLVVLRGDKGKRMWSALTWGLVPSWSDDPSIGGRMINARAETAAGKPAFRSAFRARRCIIPADGFYEWKKPDKKSPGKQTKTPYYVRPQDDRPFALAGLWEHWSAKDGSAHVDSCTILTTSPNDIVGRLHNRMPVIISPEALDVWLHAEDIHELEPLLAPYRSEAMEAHPISTRVNSPANDSSACIAPIEEDAENEGGQLDLSL